MFTIILRIHSENNLQEVPSYFFKIWALRFEQGTGKTFYLSMEVRLIYIFYTVSLFNQQKKAHTHTHIEMQLTFAFKYENPLEHAVCKQKNYIIFNL